MSGPLRFIGVEQINILAARVSIGGSDDAPTPTPIDQIQRGINRGALAYHFDVESGIAIAVPVVDVTGDEASEILHLADVLF
jgi:hypothetical protein